MRRAISEPSQRGNPSATPHTEPILKAVLQAHPERFKDLTSSTMTDNSWHYMAVMLTQNRHHCW